MSTAKDAKAAKESTKEAQAPQVEEPKPLVTTDNPEGIDLAAGAKDAEPAYKED